MEAVGFGLGIIAEVRTLVNSIKTRIAIVRHGPHTFQGLTNDLDRLTRHVMEVETLLQSAPTAIPTSTSAIFSETLASVRDTLNRSNSTLQTVCSKAFPGSSSGVVAKVHSLFRRTTRATAICDTMNAIQPQVQGASRDLLTLISMLVTGLQLDSLRITDNVAEVYRVGDSTPALLQGAHLNFSEKDADGRHTTPEGKLKESILSAVSSSKVTADAGVVTLAHGVIGMAGVGKTIALQSLAFDADIRMRFTDGIQYISLGQGATLRMATGEIAKIMRLTGASTITSAVESSQTLREAVDYAVAWFEGKITLFLVDDLWPTKECPTGFLNDLRQLLRCCSESRMAITTRSKIIADSAGCTVDFDPRVPLGTSSVNIFMMHAAGDARVKAPRGPTGDLRRSIATILTICAGLPIALAVAGCTVAFLTKEQGDFEGACDAYAKQLEKQRSDIGEKQLPEGVSLNAGITLSLKVLEAEYLKLKTAQALATEETIADLYTSLCVLRNQAWVPVSVLSRMWKVDKEFALAVVRLLSGLSLCDLTFREHAQGQAKVHGLMLHDLLLDFCKFQAEALNTNSLWHTRLLSGYLESLSSTDEVALLAEQGGSFEDSLLACTPRPWWSVPDDGYIHVDLARHLVSADMTIELAALLLNSHWMFVRAEIGGMLALKSDFECLLTLGGEILPHRVRQSFEFIWKAIQLSWGRMSEGQRAFQFQLCARLFNMRRDNAIVDSYLNGVETRTSSPYLLPANPLFPDPSSALVMEIPVGHVCCAIACSPCGQYIAVGGGRDVVVADVSKGEILKCLAGHAGVITSLSFADGAKKIVSGSWDKSVAMWEWETLGLPVQVFKGHSDWVTGVAVYSDASKIFSCADDGTVRIWNANTGAQIEEFAQQCGVNCLAISNDHRCVAICLLNGTLKVLESCTGDTIFEDSDAHEEVIISVAFSAKGQRLATGSRDKTIRVWDTATWTRIGEAFQGHTCIVYCVTFSPDGQHIASGSVDCTVRLWETNTGSCIWVSPNASSWVKCVAFSRDGERIFSGSEDGNLRIWDTRVAAEGTEPECGHSAWVEAVAISHDGLRVASGSKDRKVCLWNSPVGNQIGRPLEGHADSVKCVSFSHDGRLVVSGSLDKMVRMWDAEKLRQIGDPLEGHSDSVCCVSFSSDGLRILSGSWDTTIRIWDVKSGKQVGNALEGHTSSVEAVSESGDGCYIVSRDYDDAVIIWNRSTRTIAWQSQRLGDSETAESSERGSVPRYEVMNEEAMNIIQSCGDETPHLWPKFFPMCTVEVYCRNKSVYANIPTDATLLGTLPSYVSDWKYNKTRRVFVAGMESGAVAICNLIVRDAWVKAKRPLFSTCAKRRECHLFPSMHERRLERS